MSRKRKQAAHANHERWLVSYSDFMTLMFAFFVVMYASSQVDKAKMGKMSAAIEVAFHELGVFPGTRPGAPVDSKEAGAGASTPAEPSVRPMVTDQAVELPKVLPRTAAIPQQPGFARVEMEQLKRALEQELAPEIVRHEVTLRTGHEGLIISLSEIGFFDSGSAEMRPAAQPAFERIATVLARTGFGIRIEGHTDNVPIHTARFGSNWELSTARATEVIRLLITKYGFAASRLSAAGYGEFHPVASNSDAEGRRLNRRVDMVVLAPTPPDALKIAKDEPRAPGE
jgi:chemotaxis protein MotB